jgi:hypothetical protein
MAENDRELGEELELEAADDLKALWKIRQMPEFAAFENVLRRHVRTARKKLDDWHKDDPQTNGFCRGQVYIIKTLYRLFTREAKPVIK